MNEEGIVFVNDSEERVGNSSEKLIPLWSEVSDIGGIQPMQFCPKCKKMTMMYVHSLKEACCTNGTCLHEMKFESYVKCQEGLSEEKKKAGIIGLTSPVAVSEGQVVVLKTIAREVHEVFSLASISHGIIDEEDYTDYEMLPFNLQEALLEVAVFIDKNYKRR